MNNEMNGNVVLTDEDGQSITCRVLVTFSCEATGKDYIILTDDTVDAFGDLNLIISYYDPNKEEFELDEVTDDEEIKMAYDVIDDMQILGGEE